MKKPVAAVRPVGPSALDTLFAAGSTAVFLAMLASLAGALAMCLR